MDLLAIFSLTVLFGVSFAYVRACDRLKGRPFLD